MPIAYARSDPAVRERLLGRLGAGETLKAVCREADMPTVRSVNGWMRRDAGFAAEVAAARAAGKRARAAARAPVISAEVMAEVRSAVLARLRREGALDGAPRGRGRSAWMRRRMGQADVVEAVRRLAQQAALAVEPIAAAGAEPAKVDGRGRRFRPYDRAVGERIYVRLWYGGRLRDVLRSDPAFPSLAVLARWRRENGQFDEMLTWVMGRWRGRHPRRDGRTPALTEAIVDGIVEGGSLRSLAARPDMPCARTLYSWVRKDRRFAEAVADACEFRDEVLVGEIVDIARQAPALGAGEARRRMAPLEVQLGRLKRRPGGGRG